jgi:hypothetical protein
MNFSTVQRFDHILVLYPTPRWKRLAIDVSLHSRALQVVFLLLAGNKNVCVMVRSFSTTMTTFHRLWLNTLSTRANITVVLDPCQYCRTMEPLFILLSQPQDVATASINTGSPSLPNCSKLYPTQLRVVHEYP